MSADHDPAPLRAELERVTAERARLWEELHDQRALEREVEALRARLTYLENTASWKLTAPLRLAKRLKHQATIAYYTRSRG